MKCPFETADGPGLLLTFSSGKLDTPTKKLLESHVESCAACREFVHGQSALWSALDVWEAPAVSLDFDRRLYRKIEQQVSWWDLFLRPFRPALRHTLPIAATSGIVIMATILLDRPSAAPVIETHTAQVEALQPDQVEHALAEIEMLDQFNHLLRSDSSDSSPKM